MAIIGDGALTCGLAYEALNNAGHTDRDLIVILNDNEMSISRNVGAIHKYLTRIRRTRSTTALRDELKGLLHRAPASRTDGLDRRKVEESVKNMLVPGTLFEELGFRYFGPVDGHDLDALLDTLRR